MVNYFIMFFEFQVPFNLNIIRGLDSESDCCGCLCFLFWYLPLALLCFSQMRLLKFILRQDADHAGFQSRTCFVFYGLQGSGNY